jgi:AcrR family transcriptional regulator
VAADSSSSSTRSYRGQSPDERRDDRRRRLEAAGLALIGTEGFAASTIDRICTEAGVALRHFYEAFEGREELLRAVYDGVIAETLRATASALAAGGDDPRERARATLEAFLHAYLDDPRRGRVACVAIVGASPALERHRRSVMHRFAELIAGEMTRQARARGLAERDFRFIALGIVGTVNELVIEWLTLDEQPPIEFLRDELLVVLVAIIEGAPAADAYLAARTPRAEMRQKSRWLKSWS